MTIEELFQAAMKLSDEERLKLATLLLTSLPGPGDELPLDEDDLYNELEGRVSIEDLWKSA